MRRGGGSAAGAGAACSTDATVMAKSTEHAQAQLFVVRVSPPPHNPGRYKSVRGKLFIGRRTQQRIAGGSAQLSAFGHGCTSPGTGTGTPTNIGASCQCGDQPCTSPSGRNCCLWGAAPEVTMDASGGGSADTTGRYSQCPCCSSPRLGHGLAHSPQRRLNVIRPLSLNEIATITQPAAWKNFWPVSNRLIVLLTSRIKKMPHQRARLVTMLELLFAWWSCASAARSQRPTSATPGDVAQPDPRDAPQHHRSEFSW